MDHKSKNAQLGSTTVVKLNTALEELGLFVKGVPSKVNGSVSEVTYELARLGAVGFVFHDEELKNASEGDNLSKTRSWDSIRAVDGGPAVWEGVKGVPGLVNGSTKVYTCTGDNVTKEGKLFLFCTKEYNDLI